MKVRTIAPFAAMLAATTLAAAPLRADAPPAASGAPTSRDEWEPSGLRRLEVASALGIAHRLDDPAWFAPVEDDALLGGLEVRAFLSRRFAATVGWERFGLGLEKTGVTELGSATVARRADAAWFGLRLEPWRTEWLAAYLGFGAGLAWQHGSADGLVWPALQPARATPIACHATGGPAPALRVDVGLEAPVADGLSMFAAGGFGVFAFSDEALDGCVVGAGSAQMLTGRVGLTYAFELGGGGG